MRVRILIFILTLLSGLCTYSREKVIFKYDFSDNNQLKDWVIEGDGKAYIHCGRMILEPLFYELMDSLMKEGIISMNNNQEEYIEYLYPAMLEYHGEKDIQNYFYEYNGKREFRGGHFNIWNTKIETPENFAIEFDFRPLSPAPLHMLMFCASGNNEESIFSPNLPKRYGKSVEIMFDLSMYRVSYMHKQRGTANLRRAPGRVLTVKGPDFVSRNLTSLYRCRVEKKGEMIRYLVDGTEILSFSDKFPLKGKNWGFRLMVCAKGEYDNIEIKEIM